MLDRFIDRALSERDARELASQADQLRHLVQERRAADIGHDDPHPFEHVVIGHEGAGFELSDPSGRIVLARGSDLARVRPVASRAESDPSGEGLRKVAGNGWYVFRSEAILSDGATFRVLVGRDLGVFEEQRTTQRQTMLVATVLAALSTAPIGGLAAWRGLRPLRTVAAAARRINAHRLAERVQAPPGAPREIRELAQDFNAMIDRLEESFTRLSRFSADLAHELRTPVEHGAVLASMIEQLERLQQMIEAMLFLSRAENAGVALRYEPVELRSELDRLAAYFGVSAEERGLRIVVSGNTKMEADAHLLGQAVANLLSNAVRHAQPGSPVLVSAKELEDAVEITVANEGPGISAGDQPHVFDRFWRGDAAREDLGGSSGLGLAIVRSIARLHGGDVSLVSSPDGPTRFTIRLPRRGARSRT